MRRWPLMTMKREVGEPADGVERTAFTLAANILTAIGYALALTGLISMRGKALGWREGLMWGLAGFACVMIAPLLGLPPELPGTPSAPLADRQVWWIATAAATACGLALIAFHRKPWTAVAAIVLIAAPHVIGAPAAPEGLACAGSGSARTSVHRRRSHDQPRLLGAARIADGHVLPAFRGIGWKSCT